MVKKAVKKPAGWLYVPLRALSTLVCKVIFRLRVTGADAIPGEGPLLVLSSHQGMIDFLVLLAAFPRRRIHFVATERQFRNPKLHWAYKRLGLIPKIQFRTDPRCTMGILRVLRAGGTVGIFPAGQTSMCGVPTGIDPVIAHLIKRTGVSVCTVSLRGCFFTFPRFAKWFTRGKTEANVELTFSPDRLDALSEDEIYRALCARLDFDEFAWQAASGARFPGKKRAEGYDKVLFRCPVCGEKGTLRAQGNGIRCLSCGAAGTVEEDMRITSEGSKPLPSTLKDWFLQQERALTCALRDPAFRLAARVRCQLFEPDSFTWRDAGEGILSLSRDTLRYDGTFAGEPAALALSNRNLTGCTGAPGEFIELYYEGQGLLRYRPADQKDGWILSAIKTGQEALHRMWKDAAFPQGCS